VYRVKSKQAEDHMTINTDPVDYAHIINALGGAKALHSTLAVPDLALRAVMFWEKRNSIPGKYAPAVLSLAISRGIIKSLDDAPRINPFAPVAV
jgi:hypothetical protein